MTERERLAEMISEYILIRARNPNDERPFCEGLADFLLTRGVIVPPCKVEDTVYWYNWGGNITEAKVVGCGFTAKIEGGNEYDVRYKDLGKTVFLTREEAEAALAERRRTT